MNTIRTITIGDWYETANGNKFEVVALDKPNGTVDIQYYDGTIEELEADTWRTMGITTCAAPEDWSGSLDCEREDYGVDLDQHHNVSHNPLETLEPDLMELDIFQ